ncbi:MAG: class I tRNA ligase family protein [Blautia sp.]
MGIAVQKVYDFIWEEFCDWYIEMVKPRLYNDEDTTKAAALWTLKTVLSNALKLLHPLYAVHHRGDLLHTLSGRGVHHGASLAGVSGELELCRG